MEIPGRASILYDTSPEDPAASGLFIVPWRRNEMGVEMGLRCCQVKFRRRNVIEAQQIEPVPRIRKRPVSMSISLRSPNFSMYYGKHMRAYAPIARLTFATMAHAEWSFSTRNKDTRDKPNTWRPRYQPSTE